MSSLVCVCVRACVRAAKPQAVKGAQQPRGSIKEVIDSSLPPFPRALAVINV